jgi:hypothetical protein
VPDKDSSPLVRDLHHQPIFISANIEDNSAFAEGLLANGPEAQNRVFIGVQRIRLHGGCETSRSLAAFLILAQNNLDLSN